MHFYDIHTHRPLVNQDITAIVSVDPHSMAFETPTILHSIGIHPCHAGMAGLSTLTDLDTLAKSPNAVAIGETGLDKLAPASPEQQEKLFIAHIEIAEKHQKSLIIHCVKAWPELIRIRKRFISSIPWIIHGFRGNGVLAGQLLRYGFYFSFGLYFNPDALLVAWKSHRLYAETDDADISITDVYQRITSSLSITPEMLSREIHENLQTWPNRYTTQNTQL